LTDPQLIGAQDKTAQTISRWAIPNFRLILVSPHEVWSMEIDFKTWRPVLGSAVLVGFLIWLFHAPIEIQAALAAENRPVELASALFFFVGMAAAAYSAVRAHGTVRWYLALWALLCLLFFGEETSWLQHLLHYQTPPWIAHENIRGEFNLHNLEVFHGGELIGAEFHWRSLLKAQHLSNLGFVAYLFGLPLLAHSATGRQLLQRVKIPYPGKRLAAFAFLPLGVSAVLTLLAATQATKATVAETREMIFALVILTFLVLAANAVASKRASD
jgi:hypothetical protein